MVSTSPSRSVSCRAASSPRRAPESAASRVSSSVCSARCRAATVGWAPPLPDRRVECLLPGARQDRPHVVHRCVHPHGGVRWAAHPVQRVQVQDPFGVGPPQRRPQHPHPRPHRRVRPPLRSPVGAGGRQHLRGEVHRPPASRPDPGSGTPPPTGTRPLSTVATRGRRTATPARRQASVMPGRVRPDDRTSSAFAAHRSLAACADSRSPCTVTDRYRDRPLTGSGPTATRTSHTPGRRCRSDPPPRRISHERNRTNHASTAPTGRHAAVDGCVNGMVNGMRSCTKITRNDRNELRCNGSGERVRSTMGCPRCSWRGLVRQAVLSSMTPPSGESCSCGGLCWRL